MGFPIFKQEVEKLSVLKLKIKSGTNKPSLVYLKNDNIEKGDILIIDNKEYIVKSVFDVCEVTKALVTYTRNIRSTGHYTILSSYKLIKR